MAHEVTPDPRFFDRGILVRAATRIQRSPQDLYQVWRALTELPRFIDHVERVEVVSPTQSRWHVRGPGGRMYSWESMIINDEPNRLIAWKTTDAAQIANAGSIRFRELNHNRGTEVRLVVEYLPPGGAVGHTAAKAVGSDAESLAHEALHRFRQLMETGEIPTAKQQPAGRNITRSDRPGESDRPQTDTNVRDIARGEGARV